MFALVTVVHVVVCVFLILVVLLQSGQSADIAAAFGGMGSQTAFGARTAATVLTRATTWAAIIFMITAITLSVYSSRRTVRSRSVLGGSTSAPARNLPPPQKPPAQPPQPITPK